MKVLIRKTIFWIIALIITIGTTVYQQLSGPSYPRRVTFEVQDKIHSIKLPRLHPGKTDCPVELSLPESFSGKLIYRKYHSDNPWDTINLYRNNNTLLAFLPVQSPNDKLEYHISLFFEGNPVKLPMKENIVIRFKNTVPRWALFSWVSLMFLAIMWSNATGFQAATDIISFKKNIKITLILFIVGGLIFGAIVQYFSTGHIWAGWPWGEDFNDNKSLAAVLLWFFAYTINRHRKRRWVVIAAAILTFIVYMIPYIEHGSVL